MRKNYVFEAIYAPAERIEGIYCLRRKLVNFCHPGADAWKGKAKKCEWIENWKSVNELNAALTDCCQGARAAYLTDLTDFGKGGGRHN